MPERIICAVRDGIADVRFARPEKINAVDHRQFEAIAAMIEHLKGRKDVRCVVLSGEGRGFCVGIDLADLSADSPAFDLMPRTYGDANVFQQAAWGWRTLPMPVIAAVHGFAFGAGFQIMLGADIRIAAPDAQFSMMEIRWGLAPDVAGIALLRGNVRDDVAREITFTGRKFNGEEAKSLGIVSQISTEPREAAMVLAREIARHSPAAIRAGKRLFNLSSDCDLATILLAESEEQALLLASDGHRESLAAHREGRKPRFDD